MSVTSRAVEEHLKFLSSSASRTSSFFFFFFCFHKCIISCLYKNRIHWRCIKIHTIFELENEQTSLAPRRQLNETLILDTFPSVASDFRIWLEFWCNWYNLYWTWQVLLLWILMLIWNNSTAAVLWSLSAKTNCFV